MNGTQKVRDAGLTDIVGQHKALIEKLPEERTFVYLDYAFTTNVGDQLIVLGTLEFFRRNKLKVRYSRNIHNSEAIGKLNISEEDIVVFHGGGNFGDIYPHFQSYREEAIDRFRENRVVIFPQTVHYSTREKLARSSDRLNKHPDLTIFVRDKVSLEIMKPFFGERVILGPDMAHYLWPGLISNLKTFSAPLKDPLFLFRTDAEKGHMPSNLEVLEHRFTDWDEMISKEFRLQRKIIRWQYGLSKFGIALTDLDEAYFRLIAKEVASLCSQLNRYPIWFTSRMHGAILGLLLGKPVFAIDNSYGKLSTYFDAWADWIDPIVLLQTEEHVKQALAFVEDTRSVSPEKRWEAYCDLKARGL